MQDSIQVTSAKVDTPLSMKQKLTMSWTIVVGKGLKHNYEGTVPPHVVSRRRAKNKVAKASRKANR